MILNNASIASMIKETSEYFMIMQLLVGTLEEILEVIMTTNYTIHNPKMCSQLKLWFEINIVYVIYASG